MPVMGYPKTINYCEIACFRLCRRSRDLLSGGQTIPYTYVKIQTIYDSL